MALSGGPSSREQGEILLPGDAGLEVPVVGMSGVRPLANRAWIAADSALKGWVSTAQNIELKKAIHFIP